MISEKFLSDSDVPVVALYNEEKLRIGRINIEFEESDNPHLIEYYRVFDEMFLGVSTQNRQIKKITVDVACIPYPSNSNVPIKFNEVKATALLPYRLVCIKNTLPILMGITSGNHCILTNKLNKVSQLSNILSVVVDMESVFNEMLDLSTIKELEEAARKMAWYFYTKDNPEDTADPFSPFNLVKFHLMDGHVGISDKNPGETGVVRALFTGEQDDAFDRVGTFYKLPLEDVDWKINIDKINLQGLKESLALYLQTEGKYC